MQNSQSYKKVIVSGHIIEIYEYEKKPVGRNTSNSNDDGYDALDITQTKLELEDRKEERRQQTVRDARNITRRLAMTNFSASSKFITLTFKDNVQDIEFADDQFKNFIKKFKYKFDIDNLKYIAVREFQKRGAIHYHVLCDWSLKMATEDEIRHYERELGTGDWGVGVWKHGFVDIKQIEHVDNVGAYIIKYMTKGVAVEFFKGKKIYLCSQGLDRPKEYREEEAEEIIKFYNLQTKKEVFTNSYISEYQGNTLYKEFNLRRD